jgi:Flp pilus assembly protein TadG
MMDIGNSLRRRFVGTLASVRRRTRRENGQALVEFTLVLPVVLLILFAIIQFGLLLNTYITVTDSARAGARQLALEQGNNDPCDPAVAVATNAGSAIALPSTDVTPSFQSASGGTTTTDFCVGTISGTTTSPAAGTYSYPAGNTSTTATNPGEETQGDEAVITVTKPYTLNFFGFKFGTVHLSATASDAIE